MTWSFPIGRIFGINVRVHIILPLVMLALILKATSVGGVSLLEAGTVMLLMFGSILLHEFGHCFAARAVDGDATEVLLWPLGGLAYCDLPHTPKAHLVCAAGGPSVNLLLCVLAGSALAFSALVPPMNPFDSPYQPRLWHWRDGAYRVTTAPATTPPAETATAVRLTAEIAPPAKPVAPPTLAGWQVIAAQLFWLNWVGFLLTMLPGFPLDGGRIVQALLWWQSGDFRQSMVTAAYAGFIVTLVLGVYALVVDSVLFLLLAYFVYVSCRQQLIVLETGGDDSPFGYDFSQGYTSLENQPTQASPRRKRPNFLQRWMQQRSARRARREHESREADERRMDELLDKVHHHGLASLTDEERRFMARVSARFQDGKS